MLSSIIFSVYSEETVGIQRVNAGVKVLPELKRALQRQADREDRTLSKLGEVLLRWASEQLERAGDSQTLKTWEACPIDLGLLGKARQEALRGVEIDIEASANVQGRGRSGKRKA